jgi:hypothetical protein
MMCVVSMPLRSDVSKDSHTAKTKVVIELSCVLRQEGTFLSCSINQMQAIGQLHAVSVYPRAKRLPDASEDETVGKPVLHTAETSCLLPLTVAQPCPNYANWDSRSGVGVRKVQLFPSVTKQLE